jgi:hypothetical protein
MERHLKELYDTTQECPSVIDAILLCKIWINQRGFEKVREREGGRGRENEVRRGSGREGERERSMLREGGGKRERERERTILTSTLFHPGVWRIHWLSFLNVDMLASSLKENQPTDE